MPEPLIAPLAPGLTVKSNYTIRVTALDPTTGAVVPAVIVSGVSLFVDTKPGAGDFTELPLLSSYLMQSDGALAGSTP